MWQSKAHNFVYVVFFKGPLRTFHSRCFTVCHCRLLHWPLLATEGTDRRKLVFINVRTIPTADTQAGQGRAGRSGFPLGTVSFSILCICNSVNNKITKHLYSSYEETKHLYSLSDLFLKDINSWLCDIPGFPVYIMVTEYIQRPQPWKYLHPISDLGSHCYPRRRIGSSSHDGHK